MRIEILDKAHGDLVDGFRFYESHEAGLGTYFLDSLYSDIDSLAQPLGMRARTGRFRSDAGC